MSRSLVNTNALTPGTAARVRACGSPLTFIGADVSHGHWRCGSSWCSHCSYRRKKRAQSCIAAAIDVQQPHMLTLTVPHVRRLDERYLRQQITLVADVWRDAMSRVRWHAYRVERGDPNASDLVPPPGKPRAHPVYASTWRGRWQSTAGAGLWSREVTAGSKANPGWHVHVHVLVESRAAAELVNAAWQAAWQDITGSTQWCNTSIDELDRQNAAHYVAKYLAKQDVAKLPDRHHEAYVNGTRGMRRADAWGRWRPLGLSASEETTLTHVWRPGWRVAVPVATFYGGTALGLWLRSGVIPSDVLAVEPTLRGINEIIDDPDVRRESRRAAAAYLAKYAPAKCHPPPPPPP